MISKKNSKEGISLSGGNPKIPKGDGDSAVQAYINAMPGWMQNAGKELDALIMSAVPNACKAVRWNTPFYGTPGNGWFVGFHCLTKYVKVSFFQGTSLQPTPPIASKQKDVRYFHIFENTQLDTKLLESWFKQASTLPGENLF